MGDAPTDQNMDDELFRIIGPQKGLLIRQKLDVMEIMCPALQKRNKYKVAAMPEGLGDEADNWEDKTFKKALKKAPLFTLKEKSEFLPRLCCGSWREFTIAVTASKKAGGSKERIAEFKRPFKCTMNCGCCMLNPQEISAEDKDDKILGRTVQDWRFCDQYCAKIHWKVNDADGETKYVIENSQCCNANMFAPTMCCPTYRLDIFDASEENVVGSLIDYWPGCTTRGCLGTADNFKLEFPADASPAMKTQLLASVILIDFMLFEKSEEDGVGAA